MSFDVFLQHFQRDSALPRNDEQVVIGMDQRQAARVAVDKCEGARFLNRCAGHNEVGAVPTGVFHLHHRRAHGHHYGRRDTEALCVVGDTLGVVAGRHRNHPALPLVGRQGQEPIERPAFLEARGKLEVLEFEPDVAAADLAQRPALIAGRRHDGTTDRCRGGLHVGRRDRKVFQRRVF